MKISKTITEARVVEVDIETPAWFQVEYFGDKHLYQVNSEEDIIKVVNSTYYTSVDRLPSRYISQPEKIFAGERITECDFKAALKSALSKIAGSIPAETILLTEPISIT